LVDVHGFALVDLAGLVRGGFASVALAKVRAGGRTVEIVRMVATDIGRRALAH
jgi:hypothetical protein